MKRLLSLLLVIIVIITLSSCESKDTSSNADTNNIKETLCSNCNSKIKSTDKFCSECGYSTKDSAITDSVESNGKDTSNVSSAQSSNNQSSTNNSKHNHNYSSQSITKHPTCTEQGVKTYYCSTCSSVKTEAIAALGHKWQAATCMTPKKCSICNSTEGNTLQHKYTNNNCSTCGKEKISFNYSWEKYPLKIAMYSTSLAVINGLKCYVENDAIYAEYTCTSNRNCNVWFHIELLSSDKERISSVGRMEKFDSQGSISRKICIASGTAFLQLKEGEYYPVISNEDGVSW